MQIVCCVNTTNTRMLRKSKEIWLHYETNCHSLCFGVTWPFTEVTRGAQKSSAKHLGAKHQLSLFHFTAEDHRRGLTGGQLSVSFCCLLSREKGFCAIFSVETGVTVNAAVRSAGCLLCSRACWQAVPIWLLSGDSPVVFRGQTGD